MAMTQIHFDFDDQQSPREHTTNPPDGQAKPKSGKGRKSQKEMEAGAGEIQIPEDEILFEKQYYPIKDVAAMFAESISLIRFWTNEFAIKPRTNKKGDRFYRPEDVKLLRLIYHLLRERKYTIEGAKDFLKYEKSAMSHQQLYDELLRLKAFLLELRAGM